jgi:hypothetical protein
VGRRRATGGRAGTADPGSVVPHSRGHTDPALDCFFPVGGLGMDPWRRVHGRPPSLGDRAPGRCGTASFPRGGDDGQTATPPPGRDYLLFSGPLEAAMDLCHLGRFRTGSARSHQASSGPRTTSWCVATEVDFDSTLIAGDNHLIDAVLGAEDLGGTPIEPGDCLDSGGDTVNV